jgi:hypothetical protein
MTLLLVLFNRNLKSAKELLILGRQSDIPGRLRLNWVSGLGFHAISFRLILTVLTLIEPNCGLENQKHIVARTPDLTDCRRNAVRVRQGLVDSIAQLLHQLL